MKKTILILLGTLILLVVPSYSFFNISVRDVGIEYVWMNFTPEDPIRFCTFGGPCNVTSINATSLTVGNLTVWDTFVNISVINYTVIG